MASLAHSAVVPARRRWAPLRFLRGLVPAEGWSSVVLLAIVLLSTAWTVARTDVAPDGVSMVILAIGGLLVGLSLAKLRVTDLLAHLFAVLSGLLASILLAVERMPLAEGGRWARLAALSDLASTWIAQAQSGETLDDPKLLAIMLGTAVWLVAYTAAWVLFRRGWLTTALILPAVIAVANLGYSPEEGSLPLLVLVVAGTLLAARHAAYRRQIEWTRARLPFPNRTASRFLFGGVMIALIVAALAWTLPLSARDALTGMAWERLSEPLDEISDRWETLLRRFGGPGDASGGSYSAFGESFRLGGHLELSDEPVMVLEPAGGPMRPAYLAGQRYDAYDGHGWQTTVEETFNEIGADGQRYSSRVSFHTGQGVILSPGVLEDRSKIEAALRVIRPKGDLLFTVDTYLAADRRTNVQVAWQQLSNTPFSLTSREDLQALPLDLRGIGILLSSGAFTPPAAGSVNPDSPLPLDPSLAAELQSEREKLQSRFLAVNWEVGPDGKAQTLRATGQIPVYDDVEAVFSQERVAPGDLYTVEGLTSMASPDQLRAAGTDYPLWLSDRYLQLPPTITDRTRELASQLAVDQDNPFDIASAIETYVRTTITYNEEIDAPPANQDVVDYVLFESRQGYCEYYASAMATLVRLNGIPARVVGGYFPAPFDPAEGGHLYREKNAHLWVEVFFPGFGWIPFEPTANRDPLSYGNITAPDEEPALPTPAAPTPEPVAEPTPVPLSDAPPEQPPPAAPDLLSDPTRLAGWIGLVLAAVVALAGVVAATVWFSGFRGLSPVSSLYARALKAGPWLGVPPSPAMTPHEFADQIGRMAPSAQGPARIVADVYTQERYAGSRPGSEALRSARAAWGDLRRIAVGGLLRRDRTGRIR